MVMGVAASGMLLASSVMAADQKIAVVNFQEVMGKIPQTAALMQSLEAEFKDEKAIITQLEKDIKYYQEKDFLKAKSYSDSTLSECPDLFDNSYVWHVRGYIMYKVFFKVDNRSIESSAREESLEAFYRSITLDSLKEEQVAESKRAINQIAITYWNDAANALRDTNSFDQAIELEKVYRVVGKVSDEISVCMTLDANTGQNGIKQVQEFGKYLPISNIILNKMDGTAKGGVVIGISDQFKIPVRYIGVGEGMHDLQAFNKAEFVDSLFN